jgi:hypothetical protein
MTTLRVAAAVVLLAAYREGVPKSANSNSSGDSVAQTKELA